MTIAIYLAAPALACALSALIVLFDRAAIRKREEAERQATRARIAELRRENRRALV